MKYAIKMEFETETILDGDGMDCVMEDLIEAMYKIANNVFGPCDVTECYMKEVADNTEWRRYQEEFE